MKIAVLLTCFNRKTLTLSCLEHVLKAREAYNANHDDRINLSFFLTDDKCTDGTPDAVGEFLQNERLTIISADGNAYWAGGMRLAWRKAIDSAPFDFYLLLNDDTDVWENLFDELMGAHQYSLKHFLCCGIYSGNTTQKNDTSKITFGGKREHGTIFKKSVRLHPIGKPQECDTVNANILLVPREVVEVVNIFPDCYIHAAADNDYAKRVSKKGLKVLITSNFCGSCDADNYDVNAEYEKISKMSLKERIRYFNHPVRSIHDPLEYNKRWNKIRIPIIVILYVIHVYMPRVYCWIYNRLKK